MNYYFAPLEGVTGYLFRSLHHRYFPGVDKYYTPFIGLTQKMKFTNKELRDILPENNAGIRVVPQVLTNKSGQFLWAAEEIAKLGYEEINLNLGCPAPTVVTKGKGAGFLEDADELDEFFDEFFREYTKRGLDKAIRVSVKTRIGVRRAETFPELLAVYNRYPICELTIHPRVREDYYKGGVHMDSFAYGFENSRAKVCYNGDVRSESAVFSLQKQFPSLEAVMIGRHMFVDPAFIRSMQGGEPLSPAEDEAFFTDLFAAYSEAMGGRNAVFHMKDIWSFRYTEADEEEKKLIHRIRKAEKTEDYQSAVHRYFEARGIEQDLRK